MADHMAGHMTGYAAGHMKGKTIANQKGAVLIIFALLLLVLIGFAALAMEAGRWYMIRAELSKSVDAAALAGAKNISNPYVDPLVLAQEFGRENFPAGYAGTPAMGTTGAATFNAVQLPDHRVQVTGSVTALAYLAQLFGVNQVATSAIGVAKKNEVEIMLVLDRSGSMGFNGGAPIADLKTAATSFIGFFADTEDTDKLGLVSFATGVTVDFPLGNNYVSPMTKAIAKMNAVGATNAEDALAQTMGPGGLTDQTAVAPDKRVQQFVIFFTDGNPTAFRGRFTYSSTDYDGVAVVLSTLNTNTSDCNTVDNALYDPNNGNYLSGGMVPATPTGDGKAVGSKCGNRPGTKWQVFSQYPVPGYPDPETCGVSITPFGPLSNYVCTTGRTLAVDQAQTLKNRFVKIYTIGLGVGIDKAFLSQIASGPTFEYYAPSSSDLQAIFNMIAKDIKLRLVQ
jgi:Flp pilus assembly protein TadG